MYDSLLRYGNKSNSFCSLLNNILHIFDKDN